MDGSNPSPVDLNMKQEVLERLPDAIRMVVADFPYLVGGETPEEIDALSSGKCPTCKRDLGDETVVFFEGSGILAIMCSSLCIDDAASLGYLHERISEVLSNVQVRQAEGEQGR